MEDVVNMSLSDVIQLEKTKRKHPNKPKGHVKAHSKQHDKPKPKTNPKQKPKPIAEEDKKRLFVKNLTLDSNNASVFDHFSQYGTLTRCLVNWDKLGKSKGTAIVQYEEHAEAEKALKESNGAELKGQAIEVAWA